MDKKSEFPEEKVENTEFQDKPKSDAADENIFKSEEVGKVFHSSGSSKIYVGQPGSGKKIPFLLGVLIIILILGALFYFLKIRPGTKIQPASSPSTTIEFSSPLPSPTPSFERSKYTLRLLNGTKTQGLAASTSAKLKDLGYKIEKTGNATNSAFLKTLVRIKPGFKELLDNLLKDLMPDFKGSDGPELKDADNVDGEIILGLE